MTTPVGIHPPNPIPFPPPSPHFYEPLHLSELITGAKSTSEVVDLSLDISSIVLVTLRDVFRIPPVPYLSNAAGIALNIIAVVQTARRNRDVFKRLASDSCELVYVIICSHRHISRAESVPGDLIENLRQLVMTLTSIYRFAQRSASRTFIKAMFRSGVDTTRIQDYREMLQQSMRVFGLQSDISLRYTVAELISRQMMMISVLRHQSIDSAGTPSRDASMSSSRQSTQNSSFSESEDSSAGPFRIAPAAQDTSNVGRRTMKEIGVGNSRVNKGHASGLLITGIGSLLVCIGIAIMIYHTR